MEEPKVLLSGLGIPESPRWREGRLWFCNWKAAHGPRTGEILTLPVSVPGAGRPSPARGLR